MLNSNWRVFEVALYNLAHNLEYANVLSLMSLTSEGRSAKQSKLQEPCVRRQKEATDMITTS